MSSSIATPFFFFHPPRPPPPPLRSRRRPLSASFSAAGAHQPPPAISDDFVLKIAEKLEDSINPTLSSSASSSLLQPLRSSSSLSLLSTPWPSRRRDDAFRFTDLSFLRSLPITTPRIHESKEQIQETVFDSPFSTLLAVVDGQFIPAMSRIGGIPTGAFVGVLSDCPSGLTRDRLVTVLRNGVEFGYKDLFYDFNNVGAQDVVVVYVPEGVRMVDEPVHLMLGYSGEEEAAMRMSNTRVLVVAEKGAEVAVVEEHFGMEGGEGKQGCYWANAVVEVVVEEGARVVHSYVQRQGVKAAHTKWTVARQVRIFSRQLALDSLLC